MSGAGDGRLGSAVEYAARVHADDIRAGSGAPAIAHLLGVAANVLEDAGRAGAVDQDEAIAALLHDTAEDHGGRSRLDDVRARFGDRVAAIVEALSDSLDPDPPPWRERKEAYLRKLATETRPSVLRVSLADKLDNVRAIIGALRAHGDALWERFHPREDTLWYYGRLADLFRRRFSGPMAEEFQQAVDTLRREAGVR